MQFISGRANRNLSNRADGAAKSTDTVVFMNQTAQVNEGVANHFTFTVQNNNIDSNLLLALTRGGFDTREIVNTVTTQKDDGSNAISSVDVASTIIKASPKALRNAGFMVGAVLDDGTYENGAIGTNVTMTANDPTRTIQQMLDYIERNPQRMKSLEIISEDSDALDSSMKLTFVNPFFKNAEQTIDLSTFFDLYQYSQNRIKIDFSNANLELSDVCLLTSVIPAKSTVKYIMRFY